MYLIGLKRTLDSDIAHNCRLTFRTCGGRNDQVDILSILHVQVKEHYVIAFDMKSIQSTDACRQPIRLYALLIN